MLEPEVRERGTKDRRKDGGGYGAVYFHALRRDPIERDLSGQ